MLVAFLRVELIDSLNELEKIGDLGQTLVKAGSSSVQSFVDLL